MSHCIKRKFEVDLSDIGDYAMNFHESCDAFFDLLEHAKIKHLLLNDTCRTMADKYILAVIFFYFRRAKMTRSEYNCRNFFLALCGKELIKSNMACQCKSKFLQSNEKYNDRLFLKWECSMTEKNRIRKHRETHLSHDVYEEIEDFKEMIMENFLGSHKQYMKRYCEKFLQDRFKFLQKMQFNGKVTKQLCDALMKRRPHWAWERTRDSRHSGVFYKYISCSKCL